MRGIIIGSIALAALGGCSSEAADAERELEIIQKSHGSLDEICRARRKVADAYLKAQDADKYQLAKSHANIACLDAQMGFDSRNAADAEITADVMDDAANQAVSP